MSESEPNATTLEQARAAKTEALDIFKRLAAVTGVGISKIGGGYGLKVNVESAPASAAKLPASIRGVPVRVEVAGTVRKRAA